MKYTLPLLVCLLGMLRAPAQGTQTAVTYNFSNVPFSDVSGATVGPQDAYIYRPKAFSGPCPVIFFYHGTDAGVSTLLTVMANGIPPLLRGGMSLDNIKNPQDGTTASFIVVSPVNFNTALIPLYLDSLQRDGYPLDRSRVFVTGYSAGGLISIMDATTSDQYSKLITAIVPMSSPAVVNPMDFSLIKMYKITSWLFAGNSDAFTAKGSVVYNQKLNAALPNSSYLTIYNGGHGGWNTFYNVNYVDPVKKINIYQWMLMQKQAQTTLPVELIEQRLYKQ